MTASRHRKWRQTFSSILRPTMWTPLDTSASFATSFVELEMLSEITKTSNINKLRKFIEVDQFVPVSKCLFNSDRKSFTCGLLVNLGRFPANTYLCMKFIYSFIDFHYCTIILKTVDQPEGYHGQSCFKFWLLTLSSNIFSLDFSNFQYSELCIYKYASCFQVVRMNRYFQFWYLEFFLIFEPFYFL